MTTSSPAMEGVAEYQSLAKAVELDTEWFRSVTSQLPSSSAASPNGHIIAFNNPYSNGSAQSGSIADSTYPCSQCGMVTPSRSKHILNTCERMRDRYRWRIENILSYVDSLLDHNTFKVFCNLPDRRTATGTDILSKNCLLVSYAFCHKIQPCSVIAFQGELFRQKFNQ